MPEFVRLPKEFHLFGSLSYSLACKETVPPITTVLWLWLGFASRK